MARPRKNTRNNASRDTKDRVETNNATRDMEDRGNVADRDRTGQNVTDKTDRSNSYQSVTGTTGTDLITPEQAGSVVKKDPRYSHPRPNWGQENVQPGDNARYLRLAMVSRSLPPIDIADPKQVEQRIDEYFNFCADNDRKPNIIGMANWLGVGRDTISSWKRGEYRSATHSLIIEKAVNMLEENWADMMMNGKVNPASGIFIGKNHYGYKDVQDVVVTPKNPMGDEQNADELRERIGENVIYVDPDEQNA